MYPRTPRRQIPRNALPAWAGRTCSKVRGQEAVNSGGTKLGRLPDLGKYVSGGQEQKQLQSCPNSGSYCSLLILEQWLKAHAPSGAP